MKTFRSILYVLLISAIAIENLYPQQREQIVPQDSNRITHTDNRPRILRDSVERIFSPGLFEFYGYAFSDFIGLDDDRPNGLLQTNVFLSYKRPVYTMSVLGKDSILPPQKIIKIRLLRNVVITDITLTKIGNQKRYLPVRYSSDSTVK